MEIVVKRDLVATYVGLSTDEKPTDGVDDGAQFYEADTQDTYTFHAGVWYEGSYMVCVGE